MIEAGRFFVTGTDTDVGKTRLSAALALALRGALPAEIPLTIVKAVQTGLAAEVEGDAQRAAQLAGCAWRELLRYGKPADVYSAALAEGREPPRAGDLARAVDGIQGAVVVEGSGGAAVPLNAQESIGHLAAAARLRAVVAVGLRLGCINHALLTASHLRALGISVAGAVLVERWGPTEVAYREDVARCLARELPLLAFSAYDRNESRSVAAGAAALAGFAGVIANSLRTSCTPS